MGRLTLKNAADTICNCWKKTEFYNYLSMIFFVVLMHCSAYKVFYCATEKKCYDFHLAQDQSFFEDHNKAFLLFRLT